jgi:membrane protein
VIVNPKWRLVKDKGAEMIGKIIHFLTVDIWRIRLKDLSRRRSFLIKQLRVVLVAGRGFAEDKCQLRASALTYYSLLSIVPVVAMAFGVAKGFGFEKVLENQLLEKFPGQEEVLTQVVGFAHALLENTKGGLVAGIGIALLFWTVIKVLGNIEKSFNDIWGIKQARSIGRKFSDYLSMMLICPLLAIASSSATVFIATQITAITQRIELLGAFSPLIFFIVKLLPYCVIWVLFTFIYIFMPNGKVNFKAGLIAGVVSGTIYQAAQWFYINFQVGVAKYNAIYGSFAALPLFLVWIQLSWLIVLLGAEISFASQNVDMYEFEPDCLRASFSFKKLLSLRIVHLLVKRFAKGEAPLSEAELARSLDTPVKLVRQIVYELNDAGIISRIKTDQDKEIAYQPAKTIETLTVHHVTQALERRGVDHIPLVDGKDLETLSKSLQEFDEILSKSPANKPLLDIA